MDPFDDRLRSRGLRSTTQRRRVLAAVGQLGHATAEEVQSVLAEDGGPALPPSTVYRSLEALEESGVLRHTHLHPRSVSYQLAEHDSHIHLVCSACGQVFEVDSSVAEGFARAVEESTGFAVALTHAAVNGRCRSCRS